MKAMHGGSSDGGQTLIETMFALSMLVVGFLGILGLLSRSFFLSRVTSNNLTATYLAAEGVELAKSVVDHDVDALNPFGYTFLTTSGGVTIGGGPVNYPMDYTTCEGSGPCTLTTGISCADPSLPDPVLDLDPASHLYSYSASVATGFVRRICVSMPSANEIKVVSTVYWSTGSLTSQRVDLEDHFYNWHP